MYSFYDMAIIVTDLLFFGQYRVSHMDAYMELLHKNMTCVFIRSNKSDTVGKDFVFLTRLQALVNYLLLPSEHISVNRLGHILTSVLLAN